MGKDPRFRHLLSDEDLKAESLDRLPEVVGGSADGFQGLDCGVQTAFDTRVQRKHSGPTAQAWKTLPHCCLTAG